MAPHLIKQATIKEYAKLYKLDTLIETGTYMGEMVFAMRNWFRTIHSIELSNELYQRARKKFSSQPHIHLWQGDSAKALHQVLRHVDRPTLFWLDGHYSGGFSAKSTMSTPIMGELDAIFNHHVRDHVVLIDDARYFNGKGDYPDLYSLKQYTLSKNTESHIDVYDDIIRIYIKTQNI